MANNTYILPTTNLDDFNDSKIFELLRQEFPEFQFDDTSVFDKHGRVIAHLYFNQDCDILDFDRDIKELRNTSTDTNGFNVLADKLEKLKELNPDLNRCIISPHTPFFLEKNSIDMFLKDYFQAYIFDEGIHPEFIPPDYQSKSTMKYKRENKKGFVKTFKDFFK